MMTDPSARRLEVTTVKKLDPHRQAFRILVVIPTLGERLETLGRTLSSIQDQADVLVDAVLVAKTKTSELSAIADRYRARIIFHPGNISAAINAAFAQATEAHRYVGWLGDDDMLRPNALTIASALLEGDPAAVVTYGSCDYVDLNGNLLFNRRPPPKASALLQFIPGLIKQETCLFRLSALRQVGGLDEKLKYTMDLDLLLKLRRLGPFVKADQVLAAFCWHAGSLTIANRKASLVEAQNVQRNHARGIARMLQPLWKYPIRYLILTLNWKINRDLNQPVIPEVRGDLS
jgi:glycosyltransferase involved in cell wall biosynthesis